MGFFEKISRFFNPICLGNVLIISLMLIITC